MDPKDIAVRNVKVLRNRGRVTADVTYSVANGPHITMAVELDMARSNVALAVSALENIFRTTFVEALATANTEPKEPEPAKRAPRKRATRHL